MSFGLKVVSPSSLHVRKASGHFIPIKLGMITTDGSLWTGCVLDGSVVAGRLSGCEGEGEQPASTPTAHTATTNLATIASSITFAGTFRQSLRDVVCTPARHATPHDHTRLGNHSAVHP